jgi:hypothetical protein
MVTKYFSLKNSCLINGERFSNGIAYPLKSSLERAVTDLVEKGEARMFDGPVRFVSGVPVPLRKQDAPAPAPVVPVAASEPLRTAAYAASDKVVPGNSFRHGKKKR